MKKIFFILLIVTVIISIFSFFILPSKLENQRREKYVSYIDSIIPDINSNNVKLVTNREDVSRISQAINTYYKACETKNIEQVKDLLNSEYVKCMNINFYDLVNSTESNVNLMLENYHIYDVGHDIYFVLIDQGTNNNVFTFSAVMLNKEQSKFSVILDGYYHNNEVKKVEKEYQDGSTELQSNHEGEVNE